METRKEEDGRPGGLANMGLRWETLPAQIKALRLSLGLSLREMDLHVFQATRNRCSYSTLSRIERGKVQPPAWLLTWMQKYTTEPIVIPVPACPSCGAAHAIVDCRGLPGAPAWRQPHGPRATIREDWLARYRAVFPRPVGINGPP